MNVNDTERDIKRNDDINNIINRLLLILFRMRIIRLTEKYYLREQSEFERKLLR